ncbi:hypothetical protein DM860_016819 [Cuscuta australis]|uniref:Uncharacterized protein n=1 Tax=Cuscuta australis TaxID=267555 RepID=A0A328E0T6_9ASTE|nr:hypothetical protein DM860_016819 [Cuscuta australis]
MHSSFWVWVSIAAHNAQDDIGILNKGYKYGEFNCYSGNVVAVDRVNSLENIVVNPLAGSIVADKDYPLPELRRLSTGVVDSPTRSPPSQRSPEQRGVAENHGGFQTLVVRRCWTLSEQRSLDMEGCRWNSSPLICLAMSPFPVTAGLIAVGRPSGLHRHCPKSSKFPGELPPSKL